MKPGISLLQSEPHGGALPGLFVLRLGYLLAAGQVWQSLVPPAVTGQTESSKGSFILLSPLCLWSIVRTVVSMQGLI